MARIDGNQSTLGAAVENVHRRQVAVKENRRGCVDGKPKPRKSSSMNLPLPQ